MMLDRGAMRLRASFDAAKTAERWWLPPRLSGSSQIAETSRQGAARMHTETSHKRKNRSQAASSSTTEILSSHRHFHRNTRNQSKPVHSQHRLQILQVTLPDRDYGEGLYDGGPDIAQILAEWRARHRGDTSSSDAKGKQPIRGDCVDAEAERTKKVTAGYLPEDFFSRQGIQRPKTSVDCPAYESLDLDRQQRSYRRERQRPWLTSVDEQLRTQVLSTSMSAITAGKSDLRQLAREALRMLSPQEAEDCQSDGRLRELELTIFNAWIGSARDGIEELVSNNRFASHFVVLSQELYASMEERADTTSASSAMLQLHRAVAHRIFSTFYSISIHSDVPRKLQQMALAFCARLLRDRNLKASHARYLLRKLTTRIQTLLDASKDKAQVDLYALRDVWKELHKTYGGLIARGVLQSRDLRSTEIDDNFNHTDQYFRLASIAVPRKAVKTSTIASDVIETARSLQQASPAETMTSAFNGETTRFVTHASLLTRLVQSLAENGAQDIAYRLAYMSPPSQRRLSLLIALMRHWSSVSLRPAIGGLSPKPDEHDVSDEEGSRSHQLLADARAALHIENTNFRRHLLEVCAARMSYHAKMCCTRSMRADLTAVQEALGRKDEDVRKMPTSHIISLFDVRARSDMIRALVADSHWQKAVALAKKLSGADEPAKTAPYLNALLVASSQKQSKKPARALLSTESATRGRRVAPAPLTRFCRLLTLVERFCETTQCLPNAHTRSILLKSLSRLKSTSLDRAALEAMLRDIDWSWEKRGVPAVVANVRSILSHSRRASRLARVQPNSRPVRASSEPTSSGIATTTPIYHPIVLSLLRRRSSQYRPVKVGASRLR